MVCEPRLFRLSAVINPCRRSPYILLPLGCPSDSSGSSLPSVGGAACSSGFGSACAERTIRGDIIDPLNCTARFGPLDAPPSTRLTAGLRWCLMFKSVEKDCVLVTGGVAAGFTFLATASLANGQASNTADPNSFLAGPVPAGGLFTFGRIPPVVPLSSPPAGRFGALGAQPVLAPLASATLEPKSGTPTSSSETTNNAFFGAPCPAPARFATAGATGLPPPAAGVAGALRLGVAMLPVGVAIPPFEISSSMLRAGLPVCVSPAASTEFPKEEGGPFFPRSPPPLSSSETTK
mmetsp:Transcript_23772/g.50544  ORF Transcript_23772/g.50544 Transcript_23772/m.50544 type:complete len:292 (-) Transcript_23772:355-1230(-)